jgi:NADH dehydrogenase
VTELDVVTGAFSFTGRHIAEALLERGRRVRTLTRRPHPSHPLADRVQVAPLAFDARLVESFEGTDTFYNTYWVRFERGATTFDRAVENTARLFAAARQAGVRRIVHVSVANPDPASPFPYFRGKAQTEARLRETGVSYAIVRPTLLFGREDILVNNIAWALRRLPFLLVADDGRAPVQPVSVRDVAAMCVEAGARDDDLVLDAAGPERYAFGELVRLIGDAVGGRARIWHSSPGVALAVARVAGIVLRDVVVTRDELGALGAGLLASHTPPRGTESFAAWLSANAGELGRRYTSELARNFRV